jgi:glycosyltransferase involved in cell wall biosynthesis
LKDGTAAATGEIIVWTMADLSDDTNVIPTFVKKIEQGADMVFGSRYVKGGTSGDLSRFKRFVSNGFTFASRLFLGIKVHDITNAFRAFRKDVFDKIRPSSGDFGISPEFALKAHISGYKLDEVPTSYATRKKGIPQFKMMKMAIRYFSIFIGALFLKMRKTFQP